MIQSGDLIVPWGAPLSADVGPADAVLAYVQTVPEQGGNVLLQDGKTLKRMTADESQAAPKAGGRSVLPPRTMTGPTGAHRAGAVFPR
jgi:hypothetical protein